MEPLFGLIAAAIAASVAYLVTSERRRAQLRPGACGGEEPRCRTWRCRRGGSSEAQGSAGRSGDLRVRLEGYRRGKYERGTKIVITGLGHGAGGLSLRREGLGTAIEKRFIGEREIEIGDPVVRRRVLRAGAGPARPRDPGARDAPARSRACCGGSVAVAGREPVDVDATLSDGVLEVRVKESGFSGSREHVPAILAGALDVARLLVAPKDVAARIAENVRRGAGSRRAAAGRADARPRVPAAPGDARDAPRGARGRERGGAAARGDGPRRGGAGDAARPRGARRDRRRVRGAGDRGARGAAAGGGRGGVAAPRARGSGAPLDGPGVPRGAGTPGPARGRGPAARGAAQRGPAGVRRRGRRRSAGRGRSRRSSRCARPPSGAATCGARPARRSPRSRRASRAPSPASSRSRAGRRERSPSRTASRAPSRARQSEDAWHRGTGGRHGVRFGRQAARNPLRR